MDLERKLELLDAQITLAGDGHPADFSDWRNETDVVLRTIFGEGSATLTKFQEVTYSPSVWVSGMDTSGYRPAGVKAVVSILQAAKSERKLRDELEGKLKSAVPSPSGEGIFIVHGRDDARKYEVARLVRSLAGREPIILHEQPDRGEVLIEEFEAIAASAS